MNRGLGSASQGELEPRGERTPSSSSGREGGCKG